MSQIGRRRFLAGAGALLAAPLAHAQGPGRMCRVGALFNVSGPAMQPYRAALAECLAAHGFVEDRNLRIDARGAYGEFHQDRAIARELLAAKADALFVSGDRAVRAAHGATTTVPIVFTLVADPVAAGVVKTYAIPGGNVTGVSNRLGELLRKRLELVRELVPAASRVVVLARSLKHTIRRIGMRFETRLYAWALSCSNTVLLESIRFCKPARRR